MSMSLLYILKKYLNGGVNRYQPYMKGKVAIITGSNTGIGYETALELAKLECTVILGCRDEKKGKEALEKIKKLSKNV